MATVVIHTTEEIYRIESNTPLKEALHEVVSSLVNDGYYLIEAKDKNDIIYVPHHAVTAVHFHDS